MQIRDRVKELRRMRAGDLAPNPKNWRTHPQAQKDALRGLLAEVGYADALIGRDLPDGRTMLLDGHLRAETTPDEVVPVLIVDLTDAEADKVLATLDPLAGMAEANADRLRALIAEVETESKALSLLLQDLAGDNNIGASAEGSEVGAADGSGVVAKVYPDDAIIEAAFRHFRATGFPYRNLPAHVSMQEINRLAEADAEDLTGSNAGYHVADTYHPHRFSASAEGMRSPVECHADDATLRRAIRNEIEQGRTVPAGFFDGLKFASGTQAASNFRPGFALLLYRRFAPAGATVLDTSTGYGGRLVGFMASGLSKYIGIDPNTETHAGNLRMAAELGFSDRVELHNLPAEDVPHEAVAGRCDFAFTSPPYFRKEHYSDEPTQSWKRYTTGDAWRAGFLGPMLRLQFAALKPGRRSVVNIADVKIKNQTYPLVDWTIVEAQAAGFVHERTEEFPMQKRFGAGHDDEVATEPVLVFRKPEKT